MEDIFLPATKHTPEVAFTFSRHILSMTGELYPENAVAFFTPLMTAIDAYLGQPSDQPLTVSVALRYMNSAGTKMIFQMMGRLAGAASGGRAVVAEFARDPDDEMMVEFVEDVADAYPDLPVRVIEIA